MEPVAGLEPATHALRKRCSTTELNWRFALDPYYVLTSLGGKKFCGRGMGSNEPQKKPQESAASMHLLTKRPGYGLVEF